ncbi:MAG: DUF3052 domain-containing protein [Acidobacteriota bacterium]
MPAGYSATPLARKLGYKEGFRVALLNAPEHYRELVAPLPPRVRILSRLGRDLDLVHLFSDQRRVLERRVPQCLASIRPDGALWVSWPKKASKVPTDVTEDVVRAVALPLGLVDVKVCAVDEVWSGLKLVIRKELRGSR